MTCAAPSSENVHQGYMPGFGSNDSETEALPGALPQGRNRPQRCAYGLYAEQLSGTAFTAPRGQNERGMLELSWGGKEPLDLRSGEQRKFLEDDDIVTMRGAAQGTDYKIGFAGCAGTILPAQTAPSGSSREMLSSRSGQGA